MTQISLTYGVLPTREDFGIAFDREVSGTYRITLGHTDAKACEGFRLGDGEWSADALWQAITEIVNAEPDAITVSEDDEFEDVYQVFYPGTDRAPVEIGPDEDELIAWAQRFHHTGPAVIPLPVPALPLDQVREYIKASKSPNTLRGYAHDWKAFCAWCGEHGISPLPASPETVASYLAESAERLKVGSLQRALNAITEAHRAVKLEPPTHSPLVANTMKGIKRTFGVAPLQKTATLTDDSIK